MMLNLQYLVGKCLANTGIMATASRKRALQAHGLNSKVYGPILLHVFRARWRQGAATVLFTLDYVRNAADALKLEVRNAADLKRADLVQHFLRFAIELRPQAVFFENVPNLASIDGGSHLQRLVSGLERLGYATDLGVIPAAEFGVAQVRRRLLLVAAKEVAGRYKGDSASRPSAITMSDEERRALRRSRIRGASLGHAARRA